jgi:hypothetical protein
MRGGTVQEHNERGNYPAVHNPFTPMLIQH